MSFVQNVFKFLSKTYFILSTIVAVTFVVLNILFLAVFLNISLNSKFGIFLEEYQKNNSQFAEIFSLHNYFIMICYTLYVFGVFLFPGYIFKGINQYLSYKNSSDSVILVKKSLRLIFNCLIGSYLFSVVGFVLETFFPYSESTSEFVLKNVDYIRVLNIFGPPNFEGSICLLFAFVIYFYMKDLDKTQTLVEKNEILKAESDLVI